MAVEQIAAEHAERQVSLGRRTAAELGRLWRMIDRGNIVASWGALLPQALTVLGTSQATAAASAGIYVEDALAAQGLTDSAAGRISPGSFAGIASDGRPLASLLLEPSITALTQIGRGVAAPQALSSGRFLLDMIARTQVADAGRTAVGAAIVARPQARGYVRMVVGKTCSRCLILAGRRYEWNAGFRRHPRCDCRHVPVGETVPDDIRVNPRAYFDSLTPAEQDDIFTKAGARAIRDGADMAQVVNARRGARGLTPAGARITAEEARLLRGGRDVGRLESLKIFGQDLFVTTEGTTTRGLAGVRLGAKESGVKKGKDQRYRFARPPRLMPESIYQIAGDDRDEAIRLLRRFGYIT